MSPQSTEIPQSKTHLRATRSLSAILVIASSMALGACAVGADFGDESNASDDDGANEVPEGGADGSTTDATTTTTTGGGGMGEGAGGAGAGNTGGSPGTGGSMMDTSGETCTDAADLATAQTLAGNFTDSSTNAGSCDPTADNVAWFTYTAATDGLYDFNFTNYAAVQSFSRVAVFEGSGCAPLGAEVACETANAQTVDALIQLSAGTTYTVMFYTEGAGYPMTNPSASITASNAGPGAICELAEDVTSATFPFSAIGTYDEDPPTLGSCDTTPTNVAWFKYTAPSTGRYDIDASNQTSTFAYSRLVVLESDSCSPYGAEVACETSFSSSLATEVELVGGQDYLMAFHTDGDSYTMINPVLDIVEKGPPPPGDSCNTAIEVSAATFPVTQVGSFEDDPSYLPTCDSSMNNAAWFTYTPTSSGWYQVAGTNNETGASVTRIAIAEGTNCSTLDTQVGCEIGTATATEVAYLDASTTYMIAIYTSGDSNAMTDPTLDIQPTTAPAAGLACMAADDVSGATFPYAVTGTFTDDDYAGGSCDTTPNNAVWYRFTPTVTQAYTLDALNNTTTIAYSRLAVFESNSCSPFGTEVACATNTDQDVSVTGVTLNAGTEYLIAFYTDGETYTMVNPELTITP